ncbi:MAG TPA: ATP-binding protein [Polyangia bacterium]|jgi:signal transduction histidine kinase
MMRLSPVTWLIAIAAILIVTFVGSTALVDRNARRLDDLAADIADNAAPSITELSTARTELRHLELGVGRYLGAHRGGPPFARAQLDAWRAAVERHLEPYAQLPFFSDERVPFARLDAAKRRLYADLDRVVALLDQGQLEAARPVLYNALNHDGEEVDAVILELIGVNNRHALANAREMTKLRQRNSLLALALDASSVILGALLLLGAVRAARLYHRAQEEQRKLAEARAAELDHFAGRVAHDLKAPLASVMLGSSVAAAYPTETQQALQKIQRTSRLMSEMIDALLAVARVEPARASAPATSVAAVLDVLADEVRPVAAAARAILRVDPYPATATVACPSGVLASILSNILHNAVKFIGGASGERAIVVRVLPRDVDTRFEIEDTGPGLPPALEEHVFERFVRGSESTGLGLGLATVKRLVDGAGGRLGVVSRPGRGSCFWIELPGARPALRARG